MIAALVHDGGGGRAPHHLEPAAGKHEALRVERSGTLGEKLSRP